jgi:hypothetical protein
MGLIRVSTPSRAWPWHVVVFLAWLGAVAAIGTLILLVSYLFAMPLMSRSFLLLLDGIVLAFVAVPFALLLRAMGAPTGGWVAVAAAGLPAAILGAISASAFTSSLALAGVVILVLAPPLATWMVESGSAVADGEDFRDHRASGDA